MLLKVIKQLASTKNNFSLTIIGEVSNKEHLYNFEECQQFIKENNMEALVKVYTNVPNEKIKPEWATRTQDYELEFLWTEETIFPSQMATRPHYVSDVKY